MRIQRTNDMQSMAIAVMTSHHVEHDPVSDRHSTIQAIGSIAERGRITPQGVSVDVPYGATSFTGSGGMAWAVQSTDVGVLAWAMLGMRMFVDFSFQTPSITAPIGTTLSFTIPNLAV